MVVPSGSYRRCARRMRAEDPLTLAATYLLSPRRRHAVQAMEAFRLFVADVIADTPRADAAAGAAVLAGYGERIAAVGDVVGGAGHDVWLAAVADTRVRAGIDAQVFLDYLDARADEMATASYPTWDDHDAALARVAEPMAQMSVRFLDVDPAGYVDAARLMLAASETAYRLRFTARARTNGRLYIPVEVLEDEDVGIDTPSTDARWCDVVRAGVADSRARHKVAHAALSGLLPRMARLATIPLAISESWLDRIDARGCDVMARPLPLGSSNTARAAVAHVLRGGDRW